MLQLLLLYVSAALCACVSASGPPALRVLQVTDTHLDLFYRDGTDTRTECHTINNTLGAPLAGPLGDRLCDTPGALVRGVYAWAATLKPDLVWSFAFSSRSSDTRSRQILWTGDNGRHDNPFAPNRTWAETLQENSIVCSLLLKTFPSVPLVPSIGNNDIPINHQPINGPFLANLTAVWHDAFTSDAERAQFSTTGYFARAINSRYVCVLFLM